MKLFLLASIFFTFLSANSLDTNIASKENNSSETEKDVQRPNEDVLIVKDNSGLSADEVRLKAKNSDTKKIAKVSMEDVVNAVDEKGNVDLSKIQDKWEDLSPTPVKYDWIQTKSGEWFKGEIKALYDKKLEFDSDEIGVYTFDFEDVVRIKSYNIISVNIENLASFPGILRLKGDDLTIVQGKNRYEFQRKDIVSFAPDGKYERNFWSGKVTISFDIRSGNTNQFDYNGQVNLQRRTAISRLSFDYLGRSTSKDKVQTANNHRLNQKYDRYLTKKFFWTPLFSEYYTDEYKNIQIQVTLGLGVGYTIIDTSNNTWSVSGGPALLYTQYVTVQANNKLHNYSPALELSTKYELELNKITDMTYNYKLTYTDANAGKYKHHMILSFENELTEWLDFDVSGVWDYISQPEKAEDSTTPTKSDFQLLIGIGMEF